MKALKVVSLFDGMSCGQIALRELGIPVEEYHAFEIDRHAIKCTMDNFPGTVQHGDVTWWDDSDVAWEEIDLLLAGSPCQGFSNAGKMLNFKDPRSKLFFKFAEVRDHVLSVNPRARWLLENVNMKAAWSGIISHRLGISPVKINSALVSAQNRVRLYWTNIRTRRDGLFGEQSVDIPLPEDRGIVLRDILDKEVDEKYIVKKEKLERNNVLLQYIPGANDKSRSPRRSTGTSIDNKRDYQPVKIASRPGIIQLNKSRENSRGQPYQRNRILDASGKSSALCESWIGGVAGGSVAIVDNGIVRVLAPRECARLQTVPEWYKLECSDSRAYSLLGNGWTIEVIKHILSYMS
jgi:DNA (cytosine-5)-methyltransferase 3A